MVRSLINKNIFLLFLLGTCAFYIDKLAMGVHAPIRFWDEFNFAMVGHQNLGELFLKHGLFYWYPNIGGGMPAFAHQFSPLTPLNFLSQLVPLPVLYSVILIATISLAGFGMYAFLRRVLQLRLDLSLLGGVAYCLAFAGNPLVHDEFLFAYLFPLFLIFTSYLEAQKLSSRILGYFVSILIIGFSEPVMTAPYYAYSHLIVIWCIGPGDRITLIKKSVGAVLIWFAYGIYFSPVLYALFDYAPMVNRNYHSFTATFGEGYAYLGFLIKLLFSTHMNFILPGAVFLALSVKKLRRQLTGLMIATAIILFFRLPTVDVLHGTFLEKMDLRQSFSTAYFFYIVFIFYSLKWAASSEKHFHIFTLGLMVGNFIYIVITRLFPNILETDLTREDYLTSFLVLGSIYFYLIFKVYGHRLLNKSKFHKIVKPTILGMMVIMLFGATIVVKISTFKIDTILFRDFGDIKFIRNTIPINHVGRIATLGLPNSIVRFAGREAYGGQYAFFYRPYEEEFHKVIKPQLDKLTPKQQFIVKDYRVSLGLMLPYGLLPLGVKRFWGELPKDLGINFDLLKKANVTHIISNQRHPQLDAVSQRIIEDGYPVLGMGKPFNFSSLNSLWESFLIKYNRLSRFRKLFIYELSNSQSRIYFISDDGNSIVKPVKIIEYSPDRIIAEFTAASEGIVSVLNNYHPNWKVRVNGEPRMLFPHQKTYQGIRIRSAGKKELILEYNDHALQKIVWISPWIFLLLMAGFYFKKPNY